MYKIKNNNTCKYVCNKNKSERTKTYQSRAQHGLKGQAQGPTITMHESGVEIAVCVCDLFKDSICMNIYQIFCTL